MEKQRVYGQPCQCENAAHFHDAPALTPNGNPGHKYGQRFTHGLVAVVTEFGTFAVCADCRKDCQADSAEVR
jgi:hypothetical protein